MNKLPATTSGKIRIREVLPGDEAGISDLIRRGFGLERSASFWTWWFQGARPGMAHTRLCLDQQGKVVGMSGSNRRQMIVDGDEVTAVLSGDLYIDSHHRSHASFRRLAAKIVGDLSVKGPAFLFGFPNAQGAQAATLVRCRTVGEIQYLIRVLDATPYVARFFKLPFLVRTVAGCLNTVLRLTRTRRGDCRPDLNVREIETFDERFDTLWEQEKFRWTVATIRRADYLNWRYIASPVNYQVIAVENAAATEVLGYAVLTVTEARGRRMGALVDCLCAVSEEGVFDRLLHEAVERFVHQRCHMVRAWALPNSWMSRQLRMHRFFRRTSGFVLVVNPGVVADPGRLFDPENWYVTQGDSDHIDGDA